MDDEARVRVERATVRLPGNGGRGALVPGRFVLTAAHCVRWTERGTMCCRARQTMALTTDYMMGTAA